MTGFFHQLFNYTNTTPVPIVTANKRSFKATGKGDMYVYLPNRDKSNLRILLKDVLYIWKNLNSIFCIILHYFTKKNAKNAIRNKYFKYFQ